MERTSKSKTFAVSIVALLIVVLLAIFIARHFKSPDAVTLQLNTTRDYVIPTSVTGRGLNPSEESDYLRGHKEGWSATAEINILTISGDATTGKGNYPRASESISASYDQGWGDGIKQAYEDLAKLEKDFRSK